MSVRVIAGTHGSRRLKTPSGERTRPTSARVRKAVFSILGDIADANVLDLYAGSGALGIEALSRGAKRATFVESDRAALACIQRNLKDLELDPRANVIALRVESASAPLSAEAPFDLVFCDPPWATLPGAEEALSALRTLFAPGARVVFEHPRTREVHLNEFTAVDRRAWGDTGATFFRHGAL